MLLQLLLLFIVVPFLELVILLRLADATSWWFTLLVVLGTGAAGAILSRWQGWRVWRQIQQDMQAGRVPADGLVDGLLIFVAGGLLLTPGLITDTLGLLLLIPFTRHRIRNYLKRRFQAGFVMRQGQSGPGGSTFYWYSSTSSGHSGGNSRWTQLGDPTRGSADMPTTWDHDGSAAPNGPPSGRDRVIDSYVIRREERPSTDGES